VAFYCTLTGNAHWLYINVQLALSAHLAKTRDSASGFLAAVAVLTTPFDD
jgi:hypothetical protein